MVLIDSLYSAPACSGTVPLSLGLPPQAFGFAHCRLRWAGVQTFAGALH